MIQEIDMLVKIISVNFPWSMLHVQKKRKQFVFVSSTGPFYNMTPEERIDADNRSVYVGNVRLVYLFLLFHTEHVLSHHLI